MMWTLTAGLALANQAPCELLTGATVRLPDGAAQVDVRIDPDRILEVGPDLSPGDCAVHDLSGMVLTPGLIDPASQLGLTEVSMEHSTRDVVGGGASVRVADGYNPQSTLIPIARVRGVTSVLTVPSGGLVAGQSSWADLSGSTQADAIVHDSVALHVSIGHAAASSLRELDVLLTDARAYARNRAGYERGDARDYAAPGPDLEALQPVLSGTQPVVFTVDRASDIEAVLRFSEDHGLRAVLQGGAEAWMLADELADAGVPVILDAFLYGPRSFDSLHARPDAAAVLHDAGVQILFSTFSAHNVRELTQYAGNAVREGLPHDAALDAITRTPAQVFGMQGYGVIVAGAVPNLVAWSGDPLELSTSVQGVWIHGRPVPLVTRQTELMERYRTLPGSPVPPLSLTP